MTRPGWLTAICVIAIVLGALAIFSAIGSVAGTLMQSQIQKMQAGLNVQGAGGPNFQKMQEIQAEMMKEQFEVVRRWTPYTLLSGVIRLLEAVGLLTGAILTLGWRNSGRTILVGVAIAAMVLDLGTTFIGIGVARDNSAVVERYMPRLMEAAASQGAAPQQALVSNTMSGFVKAGFVIGILVAFGWFAIKAAFYIFTAVYLNRPQVTALFSDRPGAIQPGSL